MLKNLKDSILNKVSDLNEILKKIDFGIVSRTSFATFQKLINSIDDDAKKEILDWLSEVQKVKNDPDLNKKEKEKKLHKLQPSGTILTFLKAFVDLLIEKIPIQNKSCRPTVTCLGYIIICSLPFGIAAFTLMLLRCLTQKRCHDIRM